MESTDSNPQVPRGPAAMTFDRAAVHVPWFGKYGNRSTYRLEARSLSAIAVKDLQYLVYLRELLSVDCKANMAPTLEALEVYLSEPGVKARAAALPRGKPKVRTSTARTFGEAERQKEFGW